MKGSTQAHGKPVTLVTPPNVEQLQVQNNALKLQDVIAVVKPSFNDAEC
jgi:hypothetical protein